MSGYGGNIGHATRLYEALEARLASLDTEER